MMGDIQDGEGGQSGLQLWGQQSLPDRAGEVRQKGEAGEAVWAEGTAYREAQRQQSSGLWMPSEGPGSPRVTRGADSQSVF